MVKISQAQTPVGSIQGGVPLPTVNTNPDDNIMMMTIMMMIPDSISYRHKNLSGIM